MTIHAGEKAARLRRATASSSTSAIASLSSYTPLSSLDQRLNNGHGLPLSSSATPPSVADTDILGATDISPVLPRTTSLPSIRPRRSPSSSKLLKQNSTRPRNSTKQVQPAPSSSTLQAITGHFVFSGVDPPPSQAAGIATLDWNKFDVSQPAQVSTRAYPSTVFFIQEPSREPDNTADPQQAEAGMAGNETPSASTAKTSPRRYLPWFFTVTATPTPLPNSATAEDNIAITTIPDAEKSCEDGKEKDVNMPATKKKKKKRKSKGKVVPPVEQREAEGEASAGDDTSCLLNQSSVPASDEPLSEAATAPASHQQEMSSAAESVSTAQEGPQEDGDRSVTEPDPKPAQGGRCTRCRNPSSASTSSLSREGGFVPVPLRRSARRAQRKEAREGQIDHGKSSTPPEQVCKGLQVHHSTSNTDEETAGHTRKISKTETETSYHTASLIASRPASPGNPPQEKACDQEVATEIEGHKLESSTMSTGTEASRILSTEEAMTSIQSSTAEEMRGAMPKSSDARCTGINSELNRGCSDAHLSSVALQGEPMDYGEGTMPPSDIETPVAQAARAPSIRKLNETESERLQRTLDWRLLSAGSSSPSSQLSSQSDQAIIAPRPPKLTLDIPTLAVSPSRQEGQLSALSATSSTSRSQLALHLRRHQQRRLNYAWVHLLPSFEEMYPHRSAQRETQLRRLTWVGLEEYVARKVRTSTAQGIKETVVWITHLCPSRSATPLHRSKVSPMEPLLCSSSVWLRAASKKMNSLHCSGTSRMQDEVRAYQIKLLRERFQKDSSVSPALEEADASKANLLDLHLQPLSPRRVSPISPNTFAPRRKEHILSSSMAKSSDINRKSSSELREIVECCMYEIRNGTSTSGTGHAWLQTLDSIAPTEKEAMEAFLYDSSAQWHASIDDGLAGTDGQQSNMESWPHADVAWPTTPYASLPSHLDTVSVAGNGEDPTQDLGLSSCEMAEIQDAMFRDYLLQTNQLTGITPRYTRKKDRNVSHGRRASNSQGARSRAPSSCSHASVGGVDGQAKNGASLGPVRNCSHEGQAGLGPQTVSRAPNDRRGYNNVAPSRRQDSLDALQMPESISLPIIGSQQQWNRERQGQEETSANIDSAHHHQYDQYETWAKESENRAVRHSLANLQQHLSLVAAQKQTRGTLTSEEEAQLGREMQIPPRRQGYDYDQVLNSQQHFLRNAAHSQQTQRGYQDWSLRRDAPLTLTAATTAAATLAQNRLLQAQLQIQRQQQISQEARQLEQRHLDSFARAMDQSALHSNRGYIGFKDEDYPDAARVQAAMANNDWAGRGGMEGSAATLRSIPPTITLTEPSSLSNRLQLAATEEAGRGKMAWSDDAAQYYEEAMSHQAYLSWQAAIAQAATGSQVMAGSAYNHFVDGQQSAINRRRSSVQSMHGQTMESERLYYANDVGSQATNSFRRMSLGKTSKKNIPGPKRKGKQREGSLQKTIDAIQPQSTQHPLQSASLVLTPAERQLTEHQLQQMSFPPISSNERLRRGSIGPLNSVTIPTHSVNRKQKR